jgi:hypothetical protein
MFYHAHHSHLLDANDRVIETVEQVSTMLVLSEVPVTPLACWKVARFGGNQKA